VLQELLRQELRDGGNFDISPATNTTIALEGRFVGAIEDEERVDVESDEAEQAVVKSAQRGVGATLARLNLEQPDGDVDSEAKRAAMFLEVLDG